MVQTIIYKIELLIIRRCFNASENQYIITITISNTKHYVKKNARNECLRTTPRDFARGDERINIRLLLQQTKYSFENEL